ncbi:MAG: hypothetical protein GYA47_08495 [Desulfovibrio sp.]|nr:hypothetical protein [Desulfovibrio sp.]
MLSRKIRNVANSLGLLADKMPDEETRGYLKVCRNELVDAADMAVEFETTPLLFGCDFAREVPRG